MGEALAQAAPGDASRVIQSGGIFEFHLGTVGDLITGTQGEIIDILADGRGDRRSDGPGGSTRVEPISILEVAGTHKKPPFFTHIIVDHEISAEGAIVSQTLVIFVILTEDAFSR